MPLLEWETTTNPVAEVRFCFVEVALLTLPSASKITRAPSPGAKEMESIGVVVSLMEPPEPSSVAYMWMTPCSSSSCTIGRVWSLLTVPKTWLDQLPPAWRTSSMVSGWLEELLEVLIAAYTRPAESAFRLMWSSESWSPERAVSSAQTLSSQPSSWTAKPNVQLFWLLHITPTRLPPKAITEEMSSDFSAVVGTAKVVPQLVSSQAGLQTVPRIHTF